LQTVDESEFRRRFDLEALASNTIYLNVWEDEAEELEYLVQHFLTVRRVFLEAAQKNSAMIVFIN
jgi:hypothetical protein